MSNGVYFPCFGIFVGPLFGTEVFPLPPRQEKVHFNLVTGRPTDHYDGNPNGQYEIEIRRYMKKVLNSFIRTPTFNLFDDLDFSQAKWYEKFPFAKIRWGQKVAASAATPTMDAFRPIERNPNLFNEAPDRLPEYKGKCLVKTTGAPEHTPVAPIQSKDHLIARKQQLDVEKIKDFLGNSDQGQSAAVLEYKKFMEVVEHFRKNGGDFKPPANVIRKTLAIIRDVDSVPDMQKWLLLQQSNGTDFHAYHDTWANRKLIEAAVSTTQRAKISSYMLTCLEYNHFLYIRNQVSFLPL